MTFFDLLNTAANGLEAQRQRMNIVSDNIANAHTPGYKRKVVVFSQKAADPFSAVMARELGIKETELANFVHGNGPGQGIQVGKIIEDKTPGTKVYIPAHPQADKDGYVEMSNVDSLEEMVEMMYATRNYKANLSIVEMAKSAARETLNIGKQGG